MTIVRICASPEELARPARPRTATRPVEHCIRKKLIVCPKLLCHGDLPLRRNAERSRQSFRLHSLPRPPVSKHCIRTKMIVFQDSEPGICLSVTKGCRQPRKNCNSDTSSVLRLKCSTDPTPTKLVNCSPRQRTNSSPCCAEARCGTSPVLHNVDLRHLPLHEHGHVHKLRAACVTTAQDLEAGGHAFQATC